MKKILSLCLVLALVAAFAAGCAQAPAPQPPAQPVAEAPVEPAQTPEEPAQATEEPAQPPASDAEPADPSDETEPEPVAEPIQEPTGPVMITVEELMPIFEDDNVILIGAINPTAALVPFSHAANPIRGSFLVWTDDIYGPSADLLSMELGFGRIPLAQMEDLLSRTGGTPESLFVVYHSDAMAVGARVAWHLYMLGLDVRFLDGGVPAWRAANGRTGASSRLANQAVVSEFRAPNYNPSVNNVTLEEVIAAAQNPAQWVIVDTRAQGEYDGERTGASSGGFGTGRIAGSVHVEWSRLHDSDGIRLPDEQLLELFNFVGDRNVIVFCQGGVRSSYSWLVLRDLGFNVWNYDGSWIEWSYAASTASDYPSDVILGLTELWSDNGRVI
ncbi:MAG: rhodanese-like domain-containing protein [Oscillospiraceae bacterium]|nr:rhodanese-like domain-containing protein [Oscillospiraceae bacterium]